MWEWQSESYILKQQGHFNNMECLVYSPDGQYIATGGDDAKVKFTTLYSEAFLGSIHSNLHRANKLRVFVCQFLANA